METKERQLPPDYTIKASEVLKETLGYNEMKEIFNSIFQQKSKGIEVASIISLGTLFFGVFKAVYFSYLSGATFYYGISSQYIYINENVGYQIFRYIGIVFIMGIITIRFMNIWLSKSTTIMKVMKSIRIGIEESFLFLLIVNLDTYGVNFRKMIQEISECSKVEWISIGITMVFFLISIHCFGIVSLWIWKKHTEKGKSEETKEENSQTEKIPVKSVVSVLAIMSVVLIIGAWLYGWINEIFRGNYRVIKYDIPDAESVSMDYIFRDDGKIYGEYVVLMEGADFYVCEKLMNDGLIDGTSQILIEKNNIEVINVRAHYTKK